MLKDEIKQVQEIAMTAAKTASLVAYDKIMDKITTIEKRLTIIEKTLKAEPKKEQTLSVPPNGPSIPDNSPAEPLSEKKLAKTAK